jgi:hypothetical protein
VTGWVVRKREKVEIQEKKKVRKDRMGNAAIPRCSYLTLTSVLIHKKIF